jgi:hypothetical protein
MPETWCQVMAIVRVEAAVGYFGPSVTDLSQPDKR